MKIKKLNFTPGLLLAGGLIATGIAAMIFIAPNEFYAGYGIDLGASASLVNELKAPAGALLLAGLVMMAGIFRPAFIIPSLATAAAVYLSYGLARLLSMAVDGVPHAGQIGAAAFEMAMGLICLADLRRHARAAAAGKLGADHARAEAAGQGAA